MALQCMSGKFPVRGRYVFFLPFLRFAEDVEEEDDSTDTSDAVSLSIEGGSGV